MIKTAFEKHLYGIQRKMESRRMLSSPCPTDTPR